MKVELFLRDYGVPIAPQNHKHTRPGWINIPCPFCTGHEGYHGGFYVSGKFPAYTCWRCGKHSMIEVIATLAKVPKGRARAIMRKYGGLSSHRVKDIRKKIDRRIRKIRLPFKTMPLQKPHKDYLINRGFDPEKIVKEWNVQATPFVGPYRHRIFIPIYHKNIMVSFTTRDYTGRQEPKYKAAAEAVETFPHKWLLYGAWKVTENRVILVEGPLDVWKLGTGAVAITGLNFSPYQVRWLKQMKQIFVMFDNETGAASKQAEKVAAELSLFTEVEIIEDYGADDPGELTEQQVKEIRKEIFND